MNQSKRRLQSPLFALSLMLLGGAFGTAAQAETDLTLNDPLQPTSSLASSNLDFGMTEGNSAEVSGLGQVNNVFQLRDVSPSDWAFDALRNLVERYNCLVGYPDGTFRGDRPMTRYEFAAGLNACMEQLSRMIVADPNSVDGESLARLDRLIQAFGDELNTLNATVDDLEGRVTELEAHQFSTTTKLFGQTVIGMQGRNDYDYNYFLDRLSNDDTEINLITNTQLSLLTQFSPRSILLTGLNAGSGSTTPSNRIMQPYVGLGYEADTGNDVILSDLTYRHLVTDKLALVVGTAGVSAPNIFRGSNRVQSAGYGPLSRFAQRNPIINIGGGGSGVGLDWQIARRLSLQALYATNLGNNAEFGGLFGGDFGSTTLGTQIVASPTDNIDIAFQYMNSYSRWGTLSGNQRASGVGDDQVVIQSASGTAPISTNALGLSLDWRVASKLNVGGWVGYANSDYKLADGEVETFNWMTYLTFPDLGREGNLGGIFFGQPPKITSSNLPAGLNIPSLVSRGDFTADAGSQPSTTTHLEAFYRFNISDNISLTPGVIFVFNPLHNERNDTITIGALRTTFSF